MKYTVKINSTLLDAVMMAYHGVSRQKAKQILVHSVFSANGERIDKHPNTEILAGTLLEIIPAETNKEKKVLPTKKDAAVIYYEDEYLLAGLKPAGILSCGSWDDKTNNNYHKFLENYLAERDEKKLRLWVIHRLDREVEGLILFAKSEEIQELVKENWQSVTKKYLALTEKKPDPPTGVIESWIKDTSSQKVISYKKEVEGSKFAHTDYSFIRQEGRYFLVEAELKTGRKNQIRVHFAQIGCPITGDRKYGADGTFRRQVRLAAYKMEFNHPVKGNVVSLNYRPSDRFFRPSEKKDENYKII